MSLSGALGLISISMLSISDRRGSRSSAMNLLRLFFPQTAVRAAAVVKQMVVVDRVEVEDAVAIQKSFLLRSLKLNNITLSTRIVQNTDWNKFKTY